MDSTLGDKVYQLSYFDFGGASFWLNGRFVGSAGKPSVNPDEEILSKYINPYTFPVYVRNGTNYLLIFYSQHTVNLSFHYFMLQFWDNLILYPGGQNRSLLKERSFLFGGALLLFFLLFIVNLVLWRYFKNRYHLYVLGITFFMLTHAVATLSDTYFMWNISAYPFITFPKDLGFVFAVYCYLLAIRSYFELKSHALLIGVFMGIGSCGILYGIFSNVNLVPVVQSIMLVMVIIYATFTFFQASRSKNGKPVWIIATGLVITFSGALVYVFVYYTLRITYIELFVSAILLAYSGIPMSFTLTTVLDYIHLLKNLENQVYLRTKQLEDASAYKTRFFANVSHEFRTPLTISEGIIRKWLRFEEPIPSRLKSDLLLANRNMSRLHDMVNQIIDLTKSDQNMMQLRKSYFRVESLVSIAVESFRSMAEYKGHQFDFVPNAKEAIIFADRSKVEIMLNNLLSNAVKYTRDGGRIKISTKLKDEKILIQVVDTGIGIPEQDKELIFERFYRIKRKDEDYVEGMGVGLELSRTIARLHGGEITVQSNDGEGSCFTLELLLANPQPHEIIENIDDLGDFDQFDSNQIDIDKNLLKSELNEDSYTLLLVEDNEDMSAYITGILAEIGTIHHAKNGREALELVPKIKPDLIITDLMMPEMNGEVLVQYLSEHEQWKTIPVIVLTARALDNDKLNLLRIGVVDYITKPFEQEQLLLKTRNLLSYLFKRKAMKISMKQQQDEVQITDFSEKVASFIQQNLDNPLLSVNELADYFAQSRSTFYRNLQAETGLTPAEFIREVRLVAAHAMIQQQSSYRVEDVARAVGYKSVSAFRRVYKERFQ
jgi:signal transduction histidine kinase/DNA-binding response OmpR family regulator